MSLLLAPYNNAMRLGQGFNSYTGQICVDDAVVVNPERAENVITNDGTTMRILAQKTNKASVWRQMTEYINDGVLSTVNTEHDPSQALTLQEQDSGVQDEDQEDQDEEEEDQGQAQIDQDSRPIDDASAIDSVPAFEEPKVDDDPEIDTTDMTPEQLEQVKKDEAAKQEERNKKMEAARKAYLDKKAASLKEPVNTIAELAKKTKYVQGKFDAQRTGMGDNKGQAWKWTIKDSIGPSQTVTYNARFIDKLSEISDDLNASAALSIKTAQFGGSGSGSWLSTTKFFDSDIKFYLSVKVQSQSINFKDALEYNPIHSVNEANKEKFTECFGDSFISGFLEGGELNAVILMKVHNEGMKKDLMAEAQVALTGQGDLNLEGQGNIKLAKENLAANTETTIMVRYCGGGSIKTFDEEWTIDTLLAAANRFPYLVSQFPQRTYAILTKYESLRSFVALNPVKVSPLKYENAAVYTNMLMDAYLELKTLSQKVAADIRAVQNGTKRFKVASATEIENPVQPSQALKDFKLTTKYDASLEGLDQARREIANQMNKIVSEVNVITRDPAKATQERGTIFVGPASLQTLIPEVEYKSRRVRNQAMSGETLYAKVGEDGSPDAAKAANLEAHLFDESKSPLALSESEQIKVADLERENNEIAERTRVTAPVGSLSTGAPFCTLDNNLPTAIITEISTGQKNNTLRALCITWDNGVTLELGDDIDDYTKVVEPASTEKQAENVMVRRTLSGLSQSEVITSATIEVDGADGETRLSVVGLSVITNRGRSLQALFKNVKSESHYKSHVFEKPITDGYVSGFWGQAKDDEQAGGAEFGGRITRLGLIWTQAAAKASLYDEEELIECQVADEPLTFTEKGTVKWKPVNGVPQLICGLRSYMRGSRRSPSIRMNVKETRADGFDYRYIAFPEDPFCQATSTWMVLPELEGINVQCGTVDIDFDGVEVSRNVPFELPFKAGTTPTVICWIVDFIIKNDTDDVDIKVGPNGDTIGPTSFDLVATSSGGVIPAPPARRVSTAQDKEGAKTSEKDQKKDAPKEAVTTTTTTTTTTTADAQKAKAKVTMLSATFGWLAFDSSAAPDGSTFDAGAFALSLGKQKYATLERPYPSTFSSRPTKHFAAFSAIKAPYASDTDYRCEFDAPNTTANKLKLNLLAPAESEMGFVWVSSI
ncbi:hypothetical protein OC835_004614 [Tilletia horrida]|nr:hypothetical protein OC835_004614 [Tilletia horrida]